MKLFSKLLLTFTLIASSAFAESCDNYDDFNLRRTATADSALNQKELQEELACAFIHGDMAGIKTQLDAGANPFTIHKTEHALYFMKDVLKLDENEMEFLAAQDEHSPYLLMSQCLKNRSQENIIASWEALLKFGVSVDREPSTGSGYSTRQYIDLALEETESKAEQNKEYAPQAEQLRNLLTLMRKYQPEPAGFEYASSFRFVE